MSQEANTTQRTIPQVVTSFDDYVKTIVPNEILYVGVESDQWGLFSYPGADKPQYYLVDLKSPNGKFIAYLVNEKGEVARTSSHVIEHYPDGYQITRIPLEHKHKHLKELVSLEKIKASLREHKNERWTLDDGWEIVACSSRYYVVDTFTLVGKGNYGSVYPAYSFCAEFESPKFGEINVQHPFVLKATWILNDSAHDTFFNGYKRLMEAVEPEKHPIFQDFLHAIRKIYKNPKVTSERLVEVLKEPTHYMHVDYLSRTKDLEELQQQVERDTCAFNAVVGFAEPPLFLKNSTRCYQVMERIVGVSLNKFDCSVLSFEERLDLVIQFVTNLQLYHANGLIHFDIKKENVLIGKMNTKYGKKYQLTLFDPITQDRGNMPYQSLNALAPLQRRLHIKPMQNNLGYHPDEAVNYDEKGRPLLDEKEKPKQSMAGAKTDIEMGARRVIDPIFKDLDPDSYPKIRGVCLKYIMKKFLERMSAEYHARPGLLEVLRFYQTIYLLVSAQKKLGQPQDITVNWAKLLLIHHGLWTTKTTKEVTPENYDFERHPVVAQVILSLLEMERLNEDSVKFVLDKTSAQEINKQDADVFEKINNLAKEKDTADRQKQLDELLKPKSEQSSVINIPGTQFYHGQDMTDDGLPNVFEEACSIM